jgi:hypothetical protein
MEQPLPRMSEAAYFRLKTAMEVLEDYMREISEIKRKEKLMPTGIKYNIQELTKVYCRLCDAMDLYRRPKTRYSEI